MHLRAGKTGFMVAAIMIAKTLPVAAAVMTLPRSPGRDTLVLACRDKTHHGALKIPHHDITPDHADRNPQVDRHHSSNHGRVPYFALTPIQRGVLDVLVDTSNNEATGALE